MPKDEESEELSTQKLLRALLAVQLFGMAVTTTKKIEILSKAGMGVSDIASILNTTPNSVSVALHKLKASKAKDAKAPE